MVSGRESEQGIPGGETQAAFRQRSIAKDLPRARFHHSYSVPGGRVEYHLDELSSLEIQRRHLIYQGFIPEGHLFKTTLSGTDLYHYDKSGKGRKFVRAVGFGDQLPLYSLEK